MGGGEPGQKGGRTGDVQEVGEEGTGKGDSQGSGNRQKVGKLCNMVEYLAVIKSQRWEPEIKGYGKLKV